MADKTDISWTDHTFNPWWGCSKVAPGCDNCYAAAFDKRTGGDYWDAKIKPRLTSDANWRKPIKWNKQAAAERKRHRVFCGSMMDWCDKDAPDGALDRLWEIIRETPWLDWQLLTKRATLIERRLPDDWGNGYENVWLGVTVENIEYGYSRIASLSKVPAKLRFLSCEPLLENLTDLYKFKPMENIHWAIIGGESGHHARPMEREWVIDLIQDLDLWDIPIWFKQWGGKGRDKGGSLIDGIEVKKWPLGRSQ